MMEINKRFDELNKFHNNNHTKIMNKIEQIEATILRLENLSVKTPKTSKELLEDDWAKKSKKLDKMRDDLLDLRGLDENGQAKKK